MAEPRPRSTRGTKTTRQNPHTPEHPATAECIREHDAAEFLQVSVHTLRKWRTLARGPRYVKLGRAVGYRVSDLRRFMDEQLVPTSHPMPVARRR